MTITDKHAELIADLRAHYAGDPARLKFIDAHERAMTEAETETSQGEIASDLKEGLENWQDNPLTSDTGRVLPVTNGFLALIKTIREYESDTFSASGSEITEEEALMVANILIDKWTDRYLDGVAIDIALYSIRPDEEEHKGQHDSDCEPCQEWVRNNIPF